MKHTDTLTRMFTRTRSEKRIRTGFVIAFSLLLVACIITLYMNKRMERHARQVENTNQVIYNLETMLSRIKDGETGTRGYLITGNPDFLKPYHGSYRSADSILKEVLVLTTGNPVEQRRLKELGLELSNRETISRLNIQEFERNNKKLSDSSMRLMVASSRAMNKIRQSVKRLQDDEKMLLEQRDQKFKGSITTLNLLTLASLFIAAMLVIFGFMTYSRENRAKRLADEVYQQELSSRFDELSQANKELVRMRSEEKFSATGRIARTIAHEVRNPLTNINLASEQLKADLPSNESQAYLFDMIHRNSNRINQLISDLLSSTKFTDLLYEKVPVDQLLDEVLAEASDRIALSNVNVQKKFNAQCTVTVDKSKIKIAFLNIIINALEAMEEKKDGVLTILTETTNGKCSITISDTGSGMDEDALARLFEPYFTTRKKGNGLGLTNTQNIILNHKGEIIVESEKGKGTAFIITLDIDS
jgi:signal transduction histidine kinase